MQIAPLLADGPRTAAQKQSQSCEEEWLEAIGISHDDNVVWLYDNRLAMGKVGKKSWRDGRIFSNSYKSFGVWPKQDGF